MWHCTSCGGALAFEAQECLCGGRSESYSQARAAPAGEDAPEVRTMTWQQAMSILRRRYVVR